MNCAYTSAWLMMSIRWSNSHFYLLVHFILYMCHCNHEFLTVFRSEWVISSKPYPISLTLRQIKNILKMDESMDSNCFNMAVRILACHEIHYFRDIPIHYMDLNFCVSYLNQLSYFFPSHITNVFIILDNVSFWMRPGWSWKD